MPHGETARLKEDAVSRFESLSQTDRSTLAILIIIFCIIWERAETKYFYDFDMWEWIQEKKREGLVKMPDFLSIYRKMFEGTSNSSSGDGLRPAADRLCRLGIWLFSQR